MEEENKNTNSDISTEYEDSGTANEEISSGVDYVEKSIEQIVEESAASTETGSSRTEEMTGSENISEVTDQGKQEETEKTVAMTASEELAGFRKEIEACTSSVVQFLTTMAAAQTVMYKDSNRQAMPNDPGSTAIRNNPSLTAVPEASSRTVLPENPDLSAMHREPVRPAMHETAGNTAVSAEYSSHKGRYPVMDKVTNEALPFGNDRSANSIPGFDSGRNYALLKNGDELSEKVSDESAYDNSAVYIEQKRTRRRMTEPDMEAREADSIEIEANIDALEALLDRNDPEMSGPGPEERETFGPAGDSGYNSPWLVRRGPERNDSHEYYRDEPLNYGHAYKAERYDRTRSARDYRGSYEAYASDDYYDGTRRYSGATRRSYDYYGDEMGQEPVFHGINRERIPVYSDDSRKEEPVSRVKSAEEARILRAKNVEEAQTPQVRNVEEAQILKEKNVEEAQTLQAKSREEEPIPQVRKVEEASAPQEENRDKSPIPLAGSQEKAPISPAGETKKTGKKKKSGKKRKGGGIITMAIIVAAACVMAFSLYKIMSIRAEYKESDEAYDEVVEAAVDPEQTIEVETPDEEESTLLPVIDFAALTELNQDVVGWIYFENPSVINYPITCGRDNEYYLTHTYTGASSSSGSIFIDMSGTNEMTDNNVIIYGHNMNNGSMFAGLKKYVEEDFGTANPYFYIYTVDGGIYRYRAFAFYETTDVSDTYTLNFEDEEEYAKYLHDCRVDSDYGFGTEVDTDKPMVTLSTCTNRTEEGRYVLQGSLQKVIQEGENDISTIIWDSGSSETGESTGQ